MRELVKSIARFSWSFTALGVHEAVRLMKPQNGLAQTAATLDDLSHVAEDRLEEPVRGFHKAGERLRDSMIDSTADLVKPESLHPRRIAESASNLARRSMEAAGMPVGRAAAPDPAASGFTGSDPTEPAGTAEPEEEGWR